jgi:Zn-dependent protease
MFSLKKESCQLALLIILSIVLFIFIVSSELSGFMKGMISILLLLATGMAIRKITNADGWSGFVMLKVKEGISFINWFDKTIGKWMDRIADFGLVFGFGLLSLKLFKHIEKKFILFSILLLVVFTVFISPYLTLIAFTTMNIPGIDAKTASETGFIPFASLLILIISGYVGLLIFGLVVKSISILVSLLSFVLGASEVIDSTPGVSFVIPGLTIPLFEGAIALLILLVVHEGAHGIESLRSKVKLKSTGFLLLGFIPVGAFVDIDENSLKKRKAKDKLRVAAAGPASNLAVMFLFFIPTMVLLYLMPTFYANHLIIAGFTRNIDAVSQDTLSNLSANTVIYSVNGIQLNSLSDYYSVKDKIPANSTVLLKTDKGDFSVKTDQNGKIGILLSQPIKPEFQWVYSLYLIFALSTVLNFFVGVINLLPVQMFDGYRIVNESVKDKRIVTFLSYLVLALILLNLLPWVWQR